MTKDELIEEIINLPGDYQVCIHCRRSVRDPSGLHEVVSMKLHKTLKIIELELSED